MKMTNHKSAGKAFPSVFLGCLDTLLNPMEAISAYFFRQLEEFLDGSGSVTVEELMIDIPAQEARTEPELLVEVRARGALRIRRVPSSKA